ncbi:MAG: heavy metal-binding domain-containing protein, partial [Vicinamibacterales bacterium]
MRRIYTETIVFQVPRSTLRVLVLGSVLGSGFAVLGSPFEDFDVRASRHLEQNRQLQNREPLNQEPNRQQEPGTRNLEPGTASTGFWCPMHPNVRRDTAGETCNECG